MAAPAHSDLGFWGNLFANTDFWVAVSFVVFASVVFKLSRKAVISALDERIEKIKTDIETAENLRVEDPYYLFYYVGYFLFKDTTQYDEYIGKTP